MKKIGTIFLFIVLMVTLSGCAFMNYEEDTPRININEYTELELIQLIESLQEESYDRVEYDLDSFQKSLTSMLKNRRDSVIGLQVYTTSFNLQGGTGSGVIYKNEGNQYYAVTNHHVIENYNRIEIVYERNGLLFTIESSKVEVLGMDSTTDLAVIKFESETNFPTASFTDSYQLEVGQFVIAVGHPLGFTYFNTATIGIVSGLSRYVPSSPYEVPFIQHDAALSPGNSGGALFDVNGNIVGINNMKIVDQLASSIGFAIPSNTVQRIISDLETHGVVIRPFLGVSASTQASLCNQEQGVCVTVLEGGAAARAGLENNDVIIGYKLEDWDEFVTTRNFNELREAILNSQVGDRVIIQYIRNGVTYVSEATTLNVHPDDQ